MKPAIALSASLLFLAACALIPDVGMTPASSGAAPVTTHPSGPTFSPSAPAVSATFTPSPTAQPLTLTAVGEPRQLPAKILGASASPFYENLLGDPAKIAAVKATGPAVLRFPGGTDSNYYDWRTGLITLAPEPNPSAYYQYWLDLAPRLARGFPNGFKMEQYMPFTSQLNANVILVPNLETSSVQEQTAWFQQLAADHVLPGDVELGNEFWIAMGGDPNVMRIWPDEPRSMQVMHTYEQALRPIVGRDAKFAVQASAAIFNFQPNDARLFPRRLLQWDHDLAPAEWFDAVTVHLYPDLNPLTATTANSNPQQVFALSMGRADAGVDRTLNAIAAQVPGKEIWITEWSPHGATPTNSNRPDVVTPPMMAHLVTRETFAILRQPAVTKSLFFMLCAGATNEFQAYVQSGDQILPMPGTIALSWLDDAANGGSTFQRMLETNGKPVTGLGAFSESYQPIEGGLFRSSEKTILILQNASTEARLYQPQSKPTRVELLVASDLQNAAHVPGTVTQLDSNSPVVLPPLSIARITW